MNILSNTKGEFKFIDKEDELVTFTDYKDIPEDFQFKHVIKFVPEIPPAPHTAADHAVIGEWNDILTKLMERERNARGN